jgi:hypothetical protein
LSFVVVKKGKVEFRLKEKREGTRKSSIGQTATIDNSGIKKVKEGVMSETDNSMQKDFSSKRICFQLSNKNNRYFRAGNYGKKRVHFFCQMQENDKNFIELYNDQTPPEITHTNKLICFIKENERIIYTGKKKS